ncbi:MAG: hypothetical protein FWC20_09225 [Oscillospiraceae bacterium]|nr:hypothetical protein [Oscillospiraceae bacterium]MCL2279571.1 hypothetical protein [Oscillospiraceae bacterium]
MYEILSAMAHGDDSKCTIEDSNDMLYYSKELITAFIIDTSLSQLKTFKELEDYVANKKYA